MSIIFIRDAEFLLFRQLFPYCPIPPLSSQSFASSTHTHTSYSIVFIHLFLRLLPLPLFTSIFITALSLLAHASEPSHPIVIVSRRVLHIRLLYHLSLLHSSKHSRFRYTHSYSVAYFPVNAPKQPRATHGRSQTSRRRSYNIFEIF